MEILSPTLTLPSGQRKAYITIKSKRRDYNFTHIFIFTLLDRRWVVDKNPELNVNKHFQI
jgi:hypothetical protein